VKDKVKSETILLYLTLYIIYKIKVILKHLNKNTEMMTKVDVVVGSGLGQAPKHGRV
jgi:hypothetical protein